MLFFYLNKNYNIDMNSEEIENELELLNKKKKKYDSSRTLCAFLFCIFLFEWESFMSGDPSFLLISLMVLITIAPVIIIVFESLEIKKLKTKIKELNSKLKIDEINQTEEELSENPENKSLN